MTRRKLAIVLPLAFLIAASAGAAPPVPHQFTSGTPARAAEVNANFEFVMERTVPTGTILPYAGATAPPGFLLCNGAAVSRTTYAALFAVVAESFGRGDGANTFNVPDLRGTFARGAVGVPNQTFLPAAVNPAIETVTVTGHGLNRTGFPVRFTTTGTLPGGLVAGTTYFAIVVDENSFMVASTYALALAGTATDLTSQGTGTHTLAQAADPDAAARVASAPGGETGDAVGSRQPDALQDFRLSQSERGAPGSTQDLVYGTQTGITYNVGPSPSAGDNVIHRRTLTPTAGYGLVVPVNANVSSETRPRNVGVSWIVKY